MSKVDRKRYGYRSVTLQALTYERLEEIRKKWGLKSISETVNFLAEDTLDKIRMNEKKEVLA